MMKGNKSFRMSSAPFFLCTIFDGGIHWQPTPTLTETIWRKKPMLGNPGSVIFKIIGRIWVDWKFEFELSWGMIGHISLLDRLIEPEDVTNIAPAYIMKLS